MNITDKPTCATAAYEQDEKYTLVRRHAYSYAKRVQFWYSPKTGVIILPNGKKLELDTRTTLSELLDRIARYMQSNYEKLPRIHLMLVTGNLLDSRPSREWFNTSWGRDEESWRWDKLQATYTKEGVTIKLYSTGTYFSEEQNIDTLYQAWHTLETNIAKAFNLDTYKLAPTPASCGRDLLEISLPKDKSYPRLPERVIDLISHNFGQGRFETFTRQEETVIDSLYALDGTWMYASCISELPSGPCYRDTVNEFLGARAKSGYLVSLKEQGVIGDTYVPTCPAFYGVTVHVPTHWQHIGLIKAAYPTKDGTSVYPRLPGESFTNWTTGAEIALALNNGWQVEIHERLFWPHPQTDPLKNWRDKLVSLRYETDDPLERAAYRSILLHTIGSFSQRYTWLERTIPLQNLPLPAHVKVKPRSGLITKNGYRFLEEIALHDSRKSMKRPEWSATVWGRARARLAYFALRLPFDSVVSLMTDCVWTTSNPSWLEQEYTGKPGTFRVKDEPLARVPWPKSHADMVRRIKDQNKLKRADENLLVDENDLDVFIGE